MLDWVGENVGAILAHFFWVSEELLASKPLTRTALSSPCALPYPRKNSPYPSSKGSSKRGNVCAWACFDRNNVLIICANGLSKDTRWFLFKHFLSNEVTQSVFLASSSCASMTIIISRSLATILVSHRITRHNIIFCFMTALLPADNAFSEFLMLFSIDQIWWLSTMVHDSSIKNFIVGY